jgi:DNA processing protein
MTNKKPVILHLSLIKGVGPSAIMKLLIALVYAHDQTIPVNNQEAVRICAASLDLDVLYRYARQDFIALGLSSSLAQSLVDGLADKKLLDEEIELIEKHQVRLCTLFDADYPVLLRHITVPSPVLYCKGGSFNGRRMMAIVGARKANDYAQEVIHQLVPALRQHEWTIVSGGALGVDTMAHKAAQAHGGTVVILGSGLLSMYPHSNVPLFNRIIDQGGTVVSPFPLRTTPERWNFPMRNRLIAGMSEGCIVVQAAAKSGALITAQYALESGREVFAVPGSIFDPLSAGCHALLRQGATMVQSIDDITAIFPAAEQQTLFADEAPSAHEKSPTPTDPFLAALRQPKSVDELCDEVGCDVIEVQNRLFELQLDGTIEQDVSGQWRLRY